MRIPMETYITCDFPGGPDPMSPPPLDPPILMFALDRTTCAGPKMSLLEMGGA